MTKSEQRKRALRGRWTFILVFAVCLGPFIVAWTWYLLGQPGLGETTTNYGHLLEEPAQLETTALPVIHDRSGEDPLPPLAERRWVLLHVAAEGCGADCREVLWGTRQVRLALGRDMGRVQRVLLEPGAQADADYYAEEHDDLRVLEFEHTAARVLLEQLRHEELPSPREGGLLYLIDPLGNLIMTYPPGFDPSGLMDDLETLLRASQVG